MGQLACVTIVKFIAAATQAWRQHLAKAVTCSAHSEAAKRCCTPQAQQSDMGGSQGQSVGFAVADPMVESQGIHFCSYTITETVASKHWLCRLLSDIGADHVISLER